MKTNRTGGKRDINLFAEFKKSVEDG